VTNNLPSGYFRDLQMVKEIFLPMFGELNDCIKIAALALKRMSVNTRLLEDEKYDYIFSVEEVNKLVLKGIPFREAYRQVSTQIENNEFKPDRKVVHTHAGSAGNLCLDKIAEKKAALIKNFGFEKIEDTIAGLLK
jgi:argininosuccinate lyase